MSLTTDFLAQYSVSTQPVNEQVLREFAAYIQNPIEKATQEDIISYYTVISSGSKNTQKRKWATLSAYYKYLMRREVRNDNPTIAVRPPKTDRAKTIEWLDGDEIDLLIERTPDIMQRAVLYAGLSGLRLAEILSLQVEQLKDGRLWNVLGKGDKVRTIPLTREADEALREWVGDREAGQMFPVPRRSLQEMVYKATEKALGRRVSVHKLRHSYVTQAVKAGIPLPYVSRLAGHRSPAITELYVHLTADDLEEEVRKMDKPVEADRGLKLVYSRVG